METIKEIFDAVRANLRERLANPFTGAFCVAWAILNFRLLMVFFGKGTYQEKFAYIDTSLYPSLWPWGIRGVVLPVVAAAAYLYLYPRATRWLAEDYRKQQTKANNLMKAAAGEMLLSVDDSRNLRTRFAEAEQRWLKERDELVAQLDAEKTAFENSARTSAELRAQVANLTMNQSERKTHGGVNLVFSEPSEESRSKPTLRVPQEYAHQLEDKAANEAYSDHQLSALSFLREGRAAGVADIANALGLKRFDVQRALDRLTDLGLVWADEGEAYRIAAEGRKMLGAMVDGGQWDFSRYLRKS